MTLDRNSACLDGKERKPGASTQYPDMFVVGKLLPTSSVSVAYWREVPEGTANHLKINWRRQMSIPQNSKWKTRLVERGFPDRSFDIEFWQEQGDEAIFAAAWELVELAEEIRNGRKPTLQRTATTLKRI